MNTETNNHSLFLSHLDKSDLSRWVVAKFLVGWGESVTINPTKKAKTHSEWKKFTDNGDLYMGDKRVEVKHLSCSFTCKEDWPFGYNFIVCATHAWNRSDPKPDYFFVLSSNMENVAVVSGEDRDSWYTGDRVDSRYENVEQSFLFTPVNKVNFFKLEIT
tara:strand:- start:28 stop:507 length:480 start_codon:yes stop_codon:yes gene_type:complete